MNIIQKDFGGRVAWTTTGRSWEDKATINHGANCFGYLLQRGEVLTLPSFAELIGKHFDVTYDKTAAVVKALKEAP